MKFKVGDRVKSEEFGYGIIVEIKRFTGDDNIKFLVKFDKKDKCLHDGNGLSINKYKKNTCYWYPDFFAKSQLELVERKYTYEDLKKAPIGTKITFESGDCIIETDENNFNGGQYYREINDLANLKDKYDILGKITKIEEPEYTTVYESKPEILDEVEKRYLRNVIRPFRDKIKYIMKSVSNISGNLCYIRIIIDDFDDSSTLPYFNGNKMYKGMMIEKKYTLEELGL